MILINKNKTFFKIHKTEIYEMKWLLMIVRHLRGEKTLVQSLVEKEKCKIFDYPVKKMTTDEFKRLRKAKDLTEYFLQNSPVGAWCVVSESEQPFSDLITVGEIVERQQPGSCCATRSVDLYRLEIIF